MALFGSAVYPQASACELGVGSQDTGGNCGGLPRGADEVEFLKERRHLYVKQQAPIRHRWGGSLPTHSR